MQQNIIFRTPGIFMNQKKKTRHHHHISTIFLAKKLPFFPSYRFILSSSTGRTEPSFIRSFTFRFAKPVNTGNMFITWQAIGPAMWLMCKNPLYVLNVDIRDFRDRDWLPFAACLGQKSDRSPRSNLMFLVQSAEFNKPPEEEIFL